MKRFMKLWPPNDGFPKLVPAIVFYLSPLDINSQKEMLVVGILGWTTIQIILLSFFLYLRKKLETDLVIGSSSQGNISCGYSLGEPPFAQTMGLSRQRPGECYLTKEKESEWFIVHFWFLSSC